VSVNTQENFVIYGVDDMTGHIFVKWNLGEKSETNDDEDNIDMEYEHEVREEPKYPNVSRNKYVRVIGCISSSSGKNYVEAFHIAEIESKPLFKRKDKSILLMLKRVKSKGLNQVTHHILRCIEASASVYSKLHNEEDLDFLNYKITQNPPKYSTLSRDDYLQDLDSFQKQVCLV